MKIILPDYVDLRIRPAKARLFHFRYEERFGPRVPLKAIRNTVRVARAGVQDAPGKWKVAHSGRRIWLTATTTRGMIGAAVVSEFHGWAPGAKRAVEKLFGHALAYGPEQMNDRIGHVARKALSKADMYRLARSIAPKQA